MSPSQLHLSHTDDCVARRTIGAECAPVRGRWNEPPGGYVAEVEDPTDADAALVRRPAVGLGVAAADGD